MIANPLLDFISLFKKPEYEKVKPIEMSLDVNGKLEGGGKNGFTIAPTVMQQPPRVKENTFDRVLGFMDRRGIPDVGSLLSHGVGDLLEGGTMGNAPDYNRMGDAMEGGMGGGGFLPTVMSAASREAQSNHVVPQMQGDPTAIPFMEKQFSAAQAMRNQAAAEGSAGGATKAKTPATDAGTPAAPATQPLPGQNVVASAPMGPSPVVTDVGVGGPDMPAANRGLEQAMADADRAIALAQANANQNPAVQATGATLPPVPAAADTSTTVAAPEAAMAHSNALGAYPDVSGGYVDPMSLLPLVKNSGLDEKNLMLEAERAKAARGADQRYLNMLGLIPKAAGLFAGPHVPGSGILRGAINGANLGLEFTDRRSNNRYQEALEGLALRASQGDVEAAKAYQALLNEMGVGTSNKAEQFKAMQEVLRGGGGVPEVPGEGVASGGEGVPAGAAGTAGTAGGEVVPAGLPGTSGASGLAKKVATRAQTEERAKMFRALEPYFHDPNYADLVGKDKSAVGRMSRDQMMDLTSKIGQRKSEIEKERRLEYLAASQEQTAKITKKMTTEELWEEARARKLVLPENATKAELSLAIEQDIERRKQEAKQQEAGQKATEERNKKIRMMNALRLPYNPNMTTEEMDYLIEVAKGRITGEANAETEEWKGLQSFKNNTGMDISRFDPATKGAMLDQYSKMEDLIKEGGMTREIANSLIGAAINAADEQSKHLGPVPYGGQTYSDIMGVVRDLTDELAEQKAKKDAIQKGKHASYTSESGKKTEADMRVGSAQALVRTLFKTPHYPFDKIDPYSIMNYDKAGGASLETSLSPADLAMYENNVRPLVEGYKALEQSENFDPVSRRYRGRLDYKPDDFAHFARYGEHDREGNAIIFTNDQLIAMARMELKPGDAEEVLQKLKKMERPAIPLSKGNNDPYNDMYKFPQNFWADLISKGIGTGARTQKEQEPYRNVGEWIGPTTIRKPEPKPEDFNWVLPVSK